MSPFPIEDTADSDSRLAVNVKMKPVPLGSPIFQFDLTQTCLQAALRNCALPSDPRVSSER